MAREGNLIVPGLTAPESILPVLTGSGCECAQVSDLVRLPDAGIPLRCRIGFVDPQTGEDRILTLTQSEEDPGDPWEDDDDPVDRYEGAVTLLSIGAHGCGLRLLQDLASRLGGRYQDDGDPEATQTYPVP